MLEEFLASLKTSRFGKNITLWRHIPGRKAEFASFPAGVSEELKQAHGKIGIKKLYKHQREAFLKIKKGNNIVIVTPTASGKTLCYNLAVLDEVLKDSSTKALYLFPTKALSQDQTAELRKIIFHLEAEIPYFVYDGDASAEQRRAARKRSSIILTNPDMVHLGILPHHTKWAHFFRNLKYVVVDEMHIYRGVFGSHVANVIRRLKRICRFYGSDPAFIGCSATIGNPVELSEKIFGCAVEPVGSNGSPAGEKIFIFYNPPVIDSISGVRKSYLAETVSISSLVLKSCVSAIIFARSRKNTEIILTGLKRSLMEKPGRQLVQGYRGGYLPSERRKIEKGLKSGELSGVVCTNALELGIDIGSLDACIMAGYPGQISSMLQQAGRAGRKSSLSVAMLIASSDPLDQFMVRQPEYFFESPAESVMINPENLLVLLEHVKCAVFELPFVEGESFDGADIGAFLEFLSEQEIVRNIGGRYHWMSESYPAESVNLRSASSDNFVITARGASGDGVIGEVDFAGAASLIHKGAIYIHAGEKYLITEMDYEGRKAIAEKSDADYFTQALGATKMSILDVFEEDSRGWGKIIYGEVKVIRKVSAYKKISFRGFENLGYGEVALPENQMHTSAFCVNPHTEMLRKAESFASAGEGELIMSLNGIVHVYKKTANVFLLCDVNDLGKSIGIRRIPSPDENIQYAHEGETDAAYVSPINQRTNRIDKEWEGSLPEFDILLFIFDNYPGGIGLSEQLFKLYGELNKTAVKLIESCPCRWGCPSCVGPPDQFGFSVKKSALNLLRRMAE